MISAGMFATLLEHPASPVRHAIELALVRRLIMGLAMGLSAVAIIYSPWGKQSGAHINPATTLTFWRLGKIAGGDAIGYVIAQFVGGLLGVGVVAFLLGDRFLAPPVAAAATTPGPYGTAVAFAAETAITFVLMSVVLWVNNTPRYARFTGVAVGLLLTVYITVEAPLSGMSMNPARTFASAVAGNTWTDLWVYFLAPPLGMLLAADVYVRRFGGTAVRCAKYHHDNSKRCIFCEFQHSRQRTSGNHPPPVAATPPGATVGSV
jgi:aquaporin Z